jgi:hypothetical protein
MPSDQARFRALKSTIVRWSLLALFLVVTALAEAQEPVRPHPPAPGKGLPSGYLPTRFRIHIGGGIFPPNYSVDLQGASLVYHVSDVDRETKAIRETSKVITPSASQWRQFWKAMDEVNLWDWQAEYPNPLIADGTKWGLDIAVAGKGIRSSGSNTYPGGPAAGPKPTTPPASLRLPEESKVFDAYLKAVEGLLGGERFR